MRPGVQAVCRRSSLSERTRQAEEAAAARLALSLSNAQSSAAKRLMEEGVGGWSSIRGQDTELLKFRTGTVAKAGVGALGATVQLWAAPRIAAPSMPGRRPGH